MYYFITEKKEDFLQGKTIVYVSDRIAMSGPYLSNILNGKYACSKKLAMALSSEQKVNINDYFNEKE